MKQVIMNEKIKEKIYDVVNRNDVDEDEEFVIDNVVLMGIKKDGCIIVQEILPKL